MMKLCNEIGIDEVEFKTCFCRVIDLQGIKRLSLIEKENYDCIFWEQAGCKVYKTRPLQCKSYPFWSSNLYSAETWNNLEECCPGVNHGKIHTKKDIEKLKLYTGIPVEIK